MSHASQKNQEIEKTNHSSEKTYRCRGEDQLVERAVRSHQPALKGVAHHGLLVVLDVTATLKGSRPWGAGKLEGLGLTARGALRQSCTHAFLGLLYV
jgi:hypothetical protein